MLEFAQLRQLLTVAETGTLSAAAKALNLSQPSLTRSMQRLEEDLGVTLFDRRKNKIELNEAGALAVEHARYVMEAVEGMSDRMRRYAQSAKTVAVGSCAPAPLWLLGPELLRRLPDKTISTELQPMDVLLDGLLAERYHLIVTDAPVEQEGITFREYRTEQLFLSLPPAHRLAQREGVYLSELAGETMLLFSELGVWETLCREKMRDVRFIVQTEREAFSDLINLSAIPGFTTNLAVMTSEPPPDRVAVPILDPEASITFYLCALEARRDLLNIMD